MRRSLTFAAALAAGLLAAQLSAGAQSTESFAAWLAELRAEALANGVRAATLHIALSDIAPIPRIIELDRDQPEFTLTFREYLERVVPQARIDRARARLEDNRALLNGAANEYRVQARFIVALWGIESDFGRLTGGFPVIDALATLAFDGRRSAYFRTELLHALAILDAGHITPERMTGSWAGAMGQGQFMPSTFVNFAVDADGDGRRDIWDTQADVFASMANYLARLDWRDDQTWGREVRLPPGFDVALAGGKTIKRLGAWQALGVRRADGADLPTRQLRAGIVLPDGEGGPAFAVYDNFRALLHWNRSTYFALAVGHLADRIADR